MRRPTLAALVIIWLAFIFILIHGPGEAAELPPVVGLELVPCANGALYGLVETSTDDHVSRDVLSVTTGKRLASIFPNGDRQGVKIYLVFSDKVIVQYKSREAFQTDYPGEFCEIAMSEQHQVREDY